MYAYGREVSVPVPHGSSWKCLSAEGSVYLVVGLIGSASRGMSGGIVSDRDRFQSNPQGIPRSTKAVYSLGRLTRMVLQQAGPALKEGITTIHRASG